MAIGTAIVILGILYLVVVSQGFRTLFLIVLALGLGAVAYLADFGADKPQTIFYNYQAHPAFLMHAGDVCPPDRHVWNNWCVK